MPISPDEAASLARTAVSLVADAELTAMRAVARAIRASAGDPAARPLESEAAKKTRHLADLRRELTKDLRHLDARLAEALEAVIAEAYGMGVGEAAEELQQALPDGAPRLVSAAQASAVKTIAEDLHSTLEGLAPRVLRDAMDAYRAAAGKPVISVALGVRTRRGGAQQMLDDLASRGITEFFDRSGRRWAIESYVEMAVRAGAGQALTAGHADELTANGHDLITIYGGAWSCKACDPWIGRILSANGGSNALNVGETGETYPTLAEARAAGFGHPNCRCGIGAYFPNLTKRSKRRPNPEAYAAQQEQRRLEREIRYAKKAEAVALSPAEARERGKKVRDAQKDLRNFLAENPNLNRLRYREQIGKVI